MYDFHLKSAFFVRCFSKKMLTYLETERFRDFDREFCVVFTNMKKSRKLFCPFWLKNVGICEKRLQFDAKTLLNVYPAMPFRKVPRVFVNLEGDEKKHFKKLHAEMKKFKERNFNITDECVKCSEYYFEDGLRKVWPYFCLRQTIVRPKDQNNLSSLEEFLRHQVSNFRHQCIEKMLQNGRYCVNFKPADSKTKLKVGDVIGTIIHRHESPVLDSKIEKIYEDENILVVNKPSTIPIAPKSSFNLNSLSMILAKEFGYRMLLNVHRIDRLTSGVFIFAKNPSIVDKYRNIFESKNVKKEYLAKIEGYFPSGEIKVDQALPNNPQNSIQKDSVPSLTIFQRLEYDQETNSSLVKCFPKTGRTHQIRKHLKFLGFSIFNDNVYNEKDRLNFEKWKIFQGDKTQEKPKLAKEFEDCFMCILGPENVRKREKPLTQEMCLHSLRYEINGQIFETSWPKWASNQDYFKQTILANRQIYSH